MSNQLELIFRLSLFSAMTVFMAHCFSPRFQLQRSFDLFVLLWGYYAFSVPIDLLLGNRLEGSYLLPDMGHPALRPLVIEAYFQMLALLFGAMLAYRLIRRRHQGPSTQAWQVGPAWMEVRVLPPLVPFLAALLALLVAYQLSFETSSRAEIDEIVRGDPVAVMQSLIVDLTRAVAIVLLLLVPTRRQAFIVLGVGVLFTLITGSRTLIAYFVLLYIYRFGVTLGLRAKWMLFTGAIAILALTKPLFAAIFSVIEGAEFDFDTDVETLLPSLSAFESIDVYSYYVHFRLKEFDSAPLWGYSYLVLPVLRAIPGFLGGGSSVPTLAEQYSVELNPFYADVPTGLAFSALGEAWINFRYVGPALIGFVLGVLMATIDRARHGLLFALFLLLILRFFRSDMASLLKANFIVAGFFCLLSLGIFSLYSRAAEAVLHVLRPRSLIQ